MGLRHISPPSAWTYGTWQIWFM